MSTPSDPTPAEARELLARLEMMFPGLPSKHEKWYLLAAATLTGAGLSHHVATLYIYLTAKDEYSTSESRKNLVRRLREALVKCVAIIGVPKPLEAIFQVAEVEREEDKDYSFSREHWQSGQENRDRGSKWLDTIYKHNRAGTVKALDAHKDFAWISINITYGLYLSDHSILDEIDTEIVVLSGIMIQNMASETGWHLRGLRRVGVSFEDTEKIHQCIELVAAFGGVRVDKVPRVTDIEHEV